MKSVSIRMNVKHVHSEVIGRQLYGVKHLGEIHHLVPVLADRNGPVSLESLLDEPQQVFLIHAGGCVNVSINLSRGNIKRFLRDKQIEITA